MPGLEDRTLTEVGQAIVDAITAYYEMCGPDYTLPPYQHLTDTTAPPEDHDEGQLTVHLSRWYWSGGQPDQQTHPTLSDNTGIITAEYVIRLSRPSPLQDDDALGGSYPTGEEISASADVIMTDALTVPAALQRAFDAGLIGTCGAVMVMEYSALAASGGLAGGQWTVAVAMA